MSMLYDTLYECMYMYEVNHSSCFQTCAWVCVDYSLLPGVDINQATFFIFFPSGYHRLSIVDLETSNVCMYVCVVAEVA